MSKAAPTLFDEVYRAAFLYPKGFSPLFRQKMREARRFMLDEDMSAFLADIGWAAYKGTYFKEGYDLSDPSQLVTVTERYRKHVADTIDHVRHMARLPHKVTWIEWFEKPLARRAYEVYGSDMNEDLVPIKSGWLLMQHDKIETAFEGITFGVGITNFGSEGQYGLGIAPFTQCWQSEDMPLPFGSLYTLPTDELALSEVLTGLVGYKTPYIGIGNPGPYLPGYLARFNKDEFARNIVDQGGMMRYLLGLLATINELPVEFKHVTTSKGFMAKGNYRRFLDHSVITLKVPQTRYMALARKAVIAMRKRAHQVRGHWREDWRHPGQKIWIKEHQRGDASLGFVLHDYDVQKS
jgi:hypothetical protein